MHCKPTDYYVLSVRDFWHHLSKAKAISFALPSVRTKIVHYQLSIINSLQPVC